MRNQNSINHQSVNSNIQTMTGNSPICSPRVSITYLNSRSQQTSPCISQYTFKTNREECTLENCIYKQGHKIPRTKTTPNLYSQLTRHEDTQSLLKHSNSCQYKSSLCVGNDNNITRSSSHCHSTYDRSCDTIITRERPSVMKTLKRANRVCQSFSLHAIKTKEEETYV